MRKQDGLYDPVDYEKHPELYTSRFNSDVSISSFMKCFPQIVGSYYTFAYPLMRKRSFKSLEQVLST